MKNRFILSVLFVISLTSILMSCEDRYADTKSAGDEYMNAQKDSVPLYKTLADTTKIDIKTSYSYDTSYTYNTILNPDNSTRIDTVIKIDTTTTNDTTYTIRRWFEFEKNAALVKVYNSIHYAVYFNNPYGNYPSTSNSYLLVTYKYTASFIDGTIYGAGVVKNGYYSNQPYGLQEAIRRMRIGSKWRVFIPQAFGYGSSGLQKTDGSYLVDPYSTIIYDIELINAY